MAGLDFPPWTQEVTEGVGVRREGKLTQEKSEKVDAIWIKNDTRDFMKDLADRLYRNINWLPKE